MKKAFFLLFPFFFIFISCQKNEDKIEIYLTQEPIEFTEGIHVRDFFTDDFIKDNNESSINKINNLIRNNVRIDTINKEFIYCGDFTATKEQLEEKPFIEDSEIINFNSKSSIINFEKSVIEKFDNLKYYENKIGIQFAVCINEKPVMFGYFIKGFMSGYYSKNYIIHFTHKSNYESGYSPYISSGKKFKPLDTIKEKEFIAALKKTNRLVHE
ncbi:hypothetical protein [Flavobacterium tibetense]|jgi:hypothetical protein|uniref:Lipoprotein n=1 Tax=Flavobacterium tibetense TaxID=2233533 RepID=A0A365P4E2_9FLAO|nr:hypothetical protein [Flavobacterium tibetense]RBA29457.1 hypothetical protein DPN68_02095 [Flavobacterium tibetense]